MSTDPFEYIKPLSTEIGQPSYVEIISVSLVSERAIKKGGSPSIDLPKLAYSRNNRKGASSQYGENSQSSSGIIYDYSRRVVNNRLYKSRAIETEFRSLSANDPQSVILGCSIPTIPDPCSSIEGCKIDVAFVIDDTGSMRGVIANVMRDMQTVAGYFRRASSSARFACTYFADCSPSPGNDIVHYVSFPEQAADCNNVDDVVAILNDPSNIRGQGNDYPEASDKAIEEVINGQAGKWREEEDVIRVILLVTDAPPGGCSEGFSSTVQNRMKDTAAYARGCGIKYIIAEINSFIDQDRTNFYKEIAEINGGLYVQSDDGNNLAQLLASYIFGLCAAQVDPPECDLAEGEDLDFDSGISGWLIESPVVMWDQLSSAMRLISGYTSWQNPDMTLDVNDDGVIDPLDVLDITNYINANGPGPIPTTGSPPPFYDVNGDRFIDPLDILTIQNYINAGGGTMPPYIQPGTSEFAEARRSYKIKYSELYYFAFNAKGAKSYGAEITYGFIIPGTPDEEIAETVTVAKNSQYKRFNISYKNGDLEAGQERDIQIFIRVKGEALVDQVRVCVFIEAACSSGAVNLIANSNFNNGIQGWKDYTDYPGIGGVQISPADSPDYWDSDLRCMIISLAGAPRARYIIPEGAFEPDQEIELSFLLLSHNPVTVPELTMYAGMRQRSSITINQLQNAFVLNNGGFPYQSAKFYFTPNNVVGQDNHLEFFVGLGSEYAINNSELRGFYGEVKIDNILACQGTKNCPPGFALINLDQFNDSRSGWVGGYWVPRTIVEGAGFGGYLGVYECDPEKPRKGCTAGGPWGTATKTYTGLPVAARILITIVKITSGELLIEVSSGDITDQYFTVNSINEYEIVVQDTGSVTITFKYTGRFPYCGVQVDPNCVSLCETECRGDQFISSIRLCLKDPPKCDGSLTNLNAVVQWRDVPEKPVNIFAAFARITLRGYADPFLTSVSNIVPLAEGHLGVPLPTCNTGITCDFWKQYGNLGVAENTILKNNTNQFSDLNSINEDDESNNTEFNNWLWSIPGNKTADVRDQLNIDFDPNKIGTGGPTGTVVESIDIFLLMNIISPTGAAPAPICSPLEEFACYTGTDEISVSIDYINSRDLKKKFSVVINRDDLLDQLEDYNITSYQSWQNPNMTLDVDGDGVVGPLDVLAVTNYINANGPGPIPPIGAPPPFYDVNGDRFIDASDIKAIQDYINAGNTGEMPPYILPFNSWDAHLGLGNGLKGEKSRWVKASFILDNTRGTGLDQCTPPFDFVATGEGLLDFSKFKLVGKGTFYDPCIAEVTIERISDGSKSNEVQTIILPSPTGGTWDLLVKIGEVEKKATISGTATALQLKQAIENLSNVKSGNIQVSGTGNSATPYRIEFINDLAGVNIEQMVADGKNLTGSAIAIVEIIVEATSNERQTITVQPGTLNDLIVSFNGSSTGPIKYNASINKKQAAIAALSTIGTGNVLVTGRTNDRDTEYRGDIFVDFINALGNTNVPEMIVTPNPQYTIKTNWEGGTGTNQIQKITVDAQAGTFKIRVVNPNDITQTFDTADLSYDATSPEVRNALISSTYFTAADLKVTKTDPTPDAPNTRSWTIEFTGAFSKTNLNKLQLLTSTLKGGTIIVRTVREGSSSVDQQVVRVINAVAGFYTLAIEIGGTIEISPRIPWNTDAEGLKESIINHSRINPDDITVTIEEPDGDKVIGKYIVTFINLGDVPLMIADFGRTLLCNPIRFENVPPPPYDYPIDGICEINEDLSCQPGFPLSRPCPGDTIEPIVPCCDEDSIPDSVNVSTRLHIQRDLMDPNSFTNPSKGDRNLLTIKDAALIKGLDINKYVPYLRNFKDNTLELTDYSNILRTGLSIVLIDKKANTEGYVRTLKNHLKSHREILPTRMIWPEDVDNINI